MSMLMLMMIDLYRNFTSEACKSKHLQHTTVDALIGSSDSNSDININNENSNEFEICSSSRVFMQFRIAGI